MRIQGGRNIVPVPTQRFQGSKRSRFTLEEKVETGTIQMTGIQIVDVMNRPDIEESTMRQLKTEATSIIKMEEDGGDSFKAKN